jgi:hypothetical protein
VGLRYRPIQLTDVGNCVQVLTKIPAISRRYGSAIADVRAAWQRLIGCEAMGTAVLEEVDGAQVTTWGVGVGIFVHDAFVRELKTPPLFLEDSTRRVQRSQTRTRGGSTREMLRHSAHFRERELLFQTP